MAIRSVIIAPESSYGTAATGTYTFMRVEKWTPANDPKLDIPRETTGLTIVTQRPRPGPRIFNFSGRSRGYFDLSVHWFAMIFGLPTVANNVGGATGAHSHTFKPGGVAPLSYTIKWKQSGGQGTIWFQATGCKIKQLKMVTMADGGMAFEFSGIGRYATSIAAPTPPADTTANYLHPFAMNQQELTLDGVDWLGVKRFDITNDNGLVADWSIDDTRDASRLKLGDTTGKGDIETFLDAYAGSLMEYADSDGQLLDPVILSVTDPVSTIGTGGTPPNPSFVSTFPKGYVGGATQDDTNTDPEEKGTIELGYDSGVASIASYVFTNALAASVYTGS